MSRVPRAQEKLPIPYPGGGGREGVLSGVVGAFALSRVMASQLYGVSSTDPWIFGGVPLTLALVAMIATYLPALRASRIDPVEALHGEGRRARG